MWKASHNRRFGAGPTWAVPGLFCGAAILWLAGGVAGTRARADDEAHSTRDLISSPSSDGAGAAEGARSAESAAVNAEAGEVSGVVRMAHFSYVWGTVKWRPDESGDWSSAETNMPLREGSQIWITNGGRAEIQLDDGSVIRPGNGALLTLQTLYSDAEGEFTQIRMKDGLATVRVKSERAVYQIDMPLISVKANGPSRFRVGVGGGAEIAVTSGSATVEGAQGKSILKAGDYLNVADDKAPFAIAALPEADSFDRWNAEMDASLDDISTPTYQYAPPDIALAAGDLDNYGTWHNDADYGHVWCPRISDADWRPYCDGHWAWVNPCGWTWVAEEAWGWAPYHYGTWIHLRYGWAWVPGPAHQYWCPAVVHFCVNGGNIIWCALAPHEVRYPSEMRIRFRRGDWASYFTIGGVAVYYPAGATYCMARPLNTALVNHVRTATSGAAGPSQRPVTVGLAANHNTLQARIRFVPQNAVRAAGATTAPIAAFDGSAAYHRLTRVEAKVFTNGQAVASPPSDQAAVSGPPSVFPTIASIGPARINSLRPQPARSVLDRKLFTASSIPPVTSGKAGAPAGNAQRGPATGVASISSGGAKRLPLESQPRAIVRSNPIVNRQGIEARPGSPTAAQRAANARASLGISGDSHRSGSPPIEVNLTGPTQPVGRPQYQVGYGRKSQQDNRTAGSADRNGTPSDAQRNTGSSVAGASDRASVGNREATAPEPGQVRVVPSTSDRTLPESQRPNAPHLSPPQSSPPAANPAQQQPTRQQPSPPPAQPASPPPANPAPRSEPARSEPVRSSPPPSPPAPQPRPVERTEPARPDTGGRGKHQ